VPGAGMRTPAWTPPGFPDGAIIPPIKRNPTLSSVIGCRRTNPRTWSSLPFSEADGFTTNSYPARARPKLRRQILPPRLSAEGPFRG